MAPNIAITSPLNGAVVRRGSTVTIHASAADNVGVAKVEFLVSGTILCTVATAPYTLTHQDKQVMIYYGVNLDSLSKGKPVCMV
jgi:hypothetical protein